MEVLTTSILCTHLLVDIDLAGAKLFREVLIVDWWYL